MKCYRVTPWTKDSYKEAEQRTKAYKKQCENSIEHLKKGTKTSYDMNMTLYSTLEHPLEPYRVLNADIFEVIPDANESFNMMTAAMTNYFKEDSLFPLHRGSAHSSYMVVIYRVLPLAVNTGTPTIDESSPAQIFTFSITDEAETIEYFLNSWLASNAKYFTMKKKLDMYFGAIIHVIPLDGDEAREYTIKHSDMKEAIKSANAYIDHWLSIYNKNAAIQAKAKAVIRKAIQPEDVKKEKESLKHAAASKLSYADTDKMATAFTMKPEFEKNASKKTDKKAKKNKKEEK